LQLFGLIGSPKNKKNSPMVFRLFTLLLLTGGFSITSLSAQELRGEASYYADKFHGRPTSTGEKYDKNDLTAANKDFPVGSILRVTRVDDGRSVDVRVNDCGPHRKGRVVDLSRAAAEKIGLVRDGVTQVELKLIRLGDQGFPCGNNRTTTTQPRSVATSATPQEETSAVVPVVTYDQASTAAVASGATQYWVQFGAYAKVENARTQYEVVSQSGLENLQILKDGKNLHRLVAGPYTDRFSAEALQYYLEKEKKLNGVIRSF
jgi:rare lipoprotein A